MLTGNVSKNCQKDVNKHILVTTFLLGENTQRWQDNCQNNFADVSDGDGHLAEEIGASSDQPQKCANPKIYGHELLPLASLGSNLFKCTSGSPLHIPARLVCRHGHDSDVTTPLHPYDTALIRDTVCLAVAACRLER